MTMTQRSANKIMRGLREALAFAKGDATRVRVSTFTECPECGNMVRAVGRCSECGARVLGENAQKDGGKEC